MDKRKNSEGFQFFKGGKTAFQYFCIENRENFEKLNRQKTFEGLFKLYLNGWKNLNKEEKTKYQEQEIKASRVLEAEKNVQNYSELQNN